MKQMESIRALKHRDFIGAKFGAGSPEEEPAGLTVAQIMANPKTAELGMSVYEQLRKQFDGSSLSEGPPKNTEEVEYRQRLEGWADILEILLEETVAELERLDAGDPSLARSLG